MREREKERGREGGSEGGREEVVKTRKGESSKQFNFLPTYSVPLSNG